MAAEVIEERFPGLVEEAANGLARTALKLAAKGARVAAGRPGRALAREVLLKIAAYGNQ